MTPQHHDVVVEVARAAAKNGESVVQALATHYRELAPLLRDGVPLFEIALVLEEEGNDMRRWIEDYRRSKVAV